MQTNALVQQFDAPFPAELSERERFLPTHKTSQLYQVIRLHMLWAEINQRLVVSSAVGGIETVSGRPGQCICDPSALFRNVTGYHWSPVPAGIESNNRDPVIGHVPNQASSVRTDSANNRGIGGGKDDMGRVFR